MRLSGFGRRGSAPGVVNLGTLCAFDEYTDAATWARVLMICGLAMAPAFVTTILIETIPLPPVEVGVTASWVLGIRFFLTALCVSLGICMQYRTFAPAAGLSTISITLIAIGAACGFSVGLLPLAKFWAFPIPFAFILGTPTWMLVLVICSFIAIGTNHIRTNQQLRKQLRLIFEVVVVQSLMLLIYPAYNAAFIALSGIPQLCFVLFLPAIKFFMKWLLNRVSGHTEAGIVLVMTSADLFEALYLFKCMQSAGSINSGIALVVVDLVQNVVHLYELHRKVRVLEKTLSNGTHQLDIRNLISSFIKTPHARALQHLQVTNCSTRNAIHPLPVHLMPTQAMIPDKPFQSGEPGLSADQLNGGVEDLVLECQKVLLVEFMESVVPIFYVLYLVILFHLPNAQYYPEMQNMTIEKLSSLVRNIAIYAGFECFSLIYVHALLKWNYNISALHLLAFTLETEWIILQGTFLSWVVLNLQFTLLHYGKNLYSSILRRAD